MYQSGIEGSSIPPLTMKQCKLKKDMFIECRLRAFDGVFDRPDHLDMSGVIDVYHRRKTFGATISFKPEYIDPPCLKWLDGLQSKRDHECPTGNKTEEHYRKGLLKYMKKTTNGIGDPVHFMSNYIRYYPAQHVPRVVDGILEDRRGYYYLCNNCSSLMYMPLATAICPTATKNDILTLLERFINKQNNEFGMLDTSGINVGDEAALLVFLFQTMDYKCFNCNMRIDVASDKSIYEFFETMVTNRNHLIQGLTLEQLLTMLYSDRPPPEELRKANSRYTELMNQRIRATLLRSQRLFLNAFGAIPQSYVPWVGKQMETSQRISETPMTTFELDEIDLITEVSSQVGGELKCIPSTLGVYHATHDVCITLPHSVWLRKVNVIDSKVIPSVNAILLDSGCATNFDLVECIREERMVLSVYGKQEHFRMFGGYNGGKKLFTRVGHSEMMCEWDSKLCYIARNCAAVELDGKKYQVITVATTQTCCIIRFKRCNRWVPRYNLAIGPLMVRLPSLSLNSLTSTIGLFGADWKMQRIDPQLVYRLVVCALGGKKTSEALVTYLAGLSATKYSIGGKVVDLTGIEIQDGTPELIYTLILMCDVRRTIKWMGLILDSNINWRKARDGLYKLLISRVCHSLQQSTNKWGKTIYGAIESRMDLMYQRDVQKIQQSVTTDFSNISPFKLLDETIMLEDIPTTCDESLICKHHKTDCNHAGASCCVCCGIATAEYENYCSCCVASYHCQHKCEHACNVASHLCTICASGGMCSVKSRCQCCGEWYCGVNCPVCPVESGQIQNVIMKSTMQFPKTRQTKPMKIKVATESKTGDDLDLTYIKTLKDTDAPAVLKKYVGTKKPRTEIKVDDFTMKLDRHVKFDKPNNLIVTGMDTRMYFPYFCTKGSRQVVRAELYQHDIVDPVRMDKYCGYECIAKQSKLTVEELIDNYGDHAETTLDQLRVICLDMQLNVVFSVGRNQSYVERYGGFDDKFMHIVHSSAIQDSDVKTHWLICGQIKLKKWPPGFWDVLDYGEVNNHADGNNDTYNTVDMAQLESGDIDRVRSELTELRDIREKRIVGLYNTSPLVRQVDNKFFLSNSDVHDIRHGCVNVEINPKFAELCHECCNIDTHTSTSLASIAMTEDYDLENAEDNFTNYCKFVIMNYRQLRLDIISDQINVNSEVTIETNKRLIVLPKQMMVKSQDIVRCQTEGHTEHLVINKVGANAVCVSNFIGTHKVTKYAASLGSALRNLVVVAQSYDYVKNWKSARINKCVNGIGGSGKTHYIKQIPDLSEYVIVCKLRSALANFSKNKVKCMTLEQYLIERPKNSKIIIDEAGVMSVSEMITMCHMPNMQFQLFGDRDQIGAIDTSNVTGYRSGQTLLNYYDCEYWNTSYRYGEPYASEVLKEMYPDIVSKADHKTTWEIRKIKELGEVADLIKDTKVDVVYCFLELHRATIAELVSADVQVLLTDSNVRKVHAHQGTEGDRVMVIHFGGGYKLNSILYQRQYLCTALTRMKSHLVWVQSVNCNDNLRQIIKHSIVGGGMTTSKLPLQVEPLKLLRRLTQAEIVIIKAYLASFKDTPDMHKLDTLTKSFVKDLSYEVCWDKIKLSIANTRLTITENGTKITPWYHKPIFNSQQDRIKNLLSPLLDKMSQEQLLQFTGSKGDERSTIEESETSTVTLRRDSTSSVDSNITVLYDDNAHSVDLDDAMIRMAFEDSESGALISDNNTQSEGSKESYVTSNIETSYSTNSGSQSDGSVEIKPEKSNLIIEKVILTCQAWCSIIKLCDALLSCHVTGADLPLLMMGEVVRVKMFNGCSFAAGLKFSFEDGEYVLISSMHPNSGDSLISSICGAQRGVSGHESKLHMVLKLLDEHCSEISTESTYSYLAGRFIERLSNLGASCLEGGCDFESRNNGARWLNVNTEFIESIGVEQSEILEVPTHQRINDVIVMRDGGNLMLPANKIVYSLNDVIRVQNGIQGTEMLVDMSLSNRQLADDIMEQKITAKLTESIIIYTPKQLATNNYSFIENHVNQNNIVHVSGPCMDDTISGLLNAIGIGFINKVCRKMNCDIVGIDAQTISLQNISGFRLELENMSELESKHIHVVNQKKIKNLAARLEGASKPDGAAITKQINEIQTNPNFIRHGVTSKDLYIGYGACVDKSLTYENVFYWKRIDESNEEKYDESTGKYYTIGQHGKIVHENNLSGATILYVGEYALCVANSNWQDCDLVCYPCKAETRKVRSFCFSDNSTKPVHIPRRLYAKLLSRVMVEECDLDDLLAYARAQLSTMLYTSKGVREDIHQDLTEVFKYCAVVINIANRNRKFIKSADVLLKGAPDGTLLNTLWDIAQSTVVSKVLPMLGNVKWLDIIRHNLEQKQPKISQVLLSWLKDVHVIEVPQRYRIISRKFNNGLRNETSADKKNKFDDTDEGPKHFEPPSNYKKSFKRRKSARRRSERQDEAPSECNKTAKVSESAKNQLTTTKQMETKQTENLVEQPDGRQVCVETPQMNNNVSMAKPEKLESTVGEMPDDEFYLSDDTLEQFKSLVADGKNLPGKLDKDVVRYNNLKQQKFAGPDSSDTDSDGSEDKVQVVGLKTNSLVGDGISVARAIKYIIAIPSMCGKTTIYNNNESYTFDMNFLRTMESYSEIADALMAVNDIPGIVRHQLKFLKHVITTESDIVLLAENLILCEPLDVPGIVLMPTQELYMENLSNIDDERRVKASVKTFQSLVCLPHYEFSIFEDLERVFSYGEFIEFQMMTNHIKQIKPLTYVKNSENCTLEQIKQSIMSALGYNRDDGRIEDKKPEVKTSAHKRTLCMVYAGSVGDNTPLNAILELVHDELDVTVLAPKNAPIWYHNVEYFNYMEDYDVMTTACLDKQIPTLLPVVVNKMLGTIHEITIERKKRFDMTITVFFSLEGMTISGTERNFVLIPQYHKINEVGKCLNAQGGIGQLVRTLIAQKGAGREEVWTVASDLLVEEKLPNLGFLQPLSAFEMDSHTALFMRWMKEHNHKQASLVTLGSMRPNNVGKRLAAMVRSAEKPVVLVLGAAVKSTSELLLGSIPIPMNVGTYQTKDVLMLPKLKYAICGNLLKHVSSHGGLGTVTTFALQDIPQTIYPVAFDQKDNLTMLPSITTKIKRTLEEEINLSRINVCSLFGIDAPPPIFINQLCLTKITEPVMSIDKHKRFENGFYYYSRVTNCEQQPTVANRECVVKSCIASLRHQEVNVDSVLEREFNALSLTHDFRDPMSVMCAMMNTKYNIMIIHKTDLHHLFRHENHATIKLLVNDDVTHCDWFTNEEYDSGPTVPSVEIAIEDYIGTTDPFDATVAAREILTLLQLGTMKHSTEDYMDILKKQGANSLKYINTNTIRMFAARAFKAKNRSGKIAMRTTDITQSVTVIPCNIGYVTQSSTFKTGTFMRVYNSDGSFEAICLHDSETKTTLMVTGVRAPDASTIMIEKLGDLNITFRLDSIHKRPTIGQSLRCAINKSSKILANSMGIGVVSTGVIGCDVVYIHNTWNRKHHLEKERECIRTAKDLRIIPVDIEPKLKTQLKRGGIPRPIILQGQYKRIFEIVAESHKSHDATSRFLRAMQEVTPLTATSFDVTRLNDEIIKSLLSLSLSKIDTDTEKVLAYKNVVDTVYPAKTTLREVLSITYNGDVFSADAGVDNSILRPTRYWLSANRVDENFDVPMVKVETQFPAKMLTTLVSNRHKFTSDHLLIAKNFSVYQIEFSGSGIEQYKHNLWAETTERLNKQHKWDLPTVGALPDSVETVTDKKSNAKEASKLADSLVVYERQQEIAECASESTWVTSKNCRLIDMYENSEGLMSFDIVKIDDLADAKTMDYWDNTNQLIDPIIHLPLGANTAKARIQPQSIGYSTKLIMEEYPKYARPALTRAFGEEFNSMTSRYGHYEKLAEKTISVQNEYQMFVHNYYRDDHKQILSAYKNNEIRFDIEDVKDWISQHKYPKYILRTLKQHVEGSWEMHKINDTEVHAKVEQVTKLNKMSQWYSEMISRSIVAGSYAISAIFGSMFIKVKKRLIDVLSKKILYADGLTPQQLGTHMATIKNVQSFIEDDLTKQDRQTTHLLIGVERLVYLGLGLNQDLCDFYLQCHREWKWKGHGTSGYCDAMRLTGQVTTALGNMIVNLIVHNRLFARNVDKIEQMYVLGDDNIIFANNNIDIQGHGTTVRKYYNMISKVKSNENVGVFLSMIVHKMGDTVGLCPYYKRLRENFSVCNYSFNPLEMGSKIDNRTVSYCFMLGQIEESQNICKSICPNAIIPNWYNVKSAVEANAVYDNVCAAQVELHIGALLYMMKNRSKVIRKKFTHWSERVPKGAQNAK
jgi:hypothetical protein